jgi:predicted extracellular nuclease
LTIVEYFNFDRFGEFVLASERLIQPTAIFEPSADPLSDRALLADLNSRSRITVDDGRTASNPDPSIHPNGAEFNLGNLFRGGDLVTDTTGVMGYAFGQYRIQPTQGAVHTSANPRTAEPDPVGDGLRFASFNVLNYFSTLDDSGRICGPAQDQGCRGADNAEEFTRQRDKIIAAITALDADVVGLIEIENHVDDAAVIDLVAGLNDASAPDTWDYVDTNPIGDDVIKVAFVFKPASVSEVGAPAILDSVVDPRFDDQFNRPALAQTFLDTSNGAVFTLVINHLKSKGSDCDDVGDPDEDDGAGNCNLTRKAAAEAMVDWLASDPTDSGDADIIVLGDLNSYDKEDPIDVFTDAGYTDMAAMFEGELAYSYVFSGAVGYLDYALASPGLLSQITGVTNWHINADEPDLIDYDTSFKRDAQDAIYAPDAYRSSDHDPVLGGADLLQYGFGGFRPPVGAVPALNAVNAGRAIPVKFMLNDDYGTDIIAPGYPKSQEIDCGDLSVIGDAEFAPSDGYMGLTYEDGQYKWVWKTSKTYRNSCRQFVIQLTDGGMHYANFMFK